MGGRGIMFSRKVFVKKLLTKRIWSGAMLYTMYERLDAQDPKESLDLVLLGWKEI